MALGFLRGGDRQPKRGPGADTESPAARAQIATDLVRDLLRCVEGFVVSTPDLDAPAFLRRLRKTSDQLTLDMDAEELDCHSMWAADSLAGYGQAQRACLAQREEELWQLIALYQEHQKGDGQANQQFNDAMRATHERLGSVMRLSDLRQMRERLQAELNRAETIISDKQRADSGRSEELARRIHQLETALVQARSEASRDPLTGVMNRGAFNQILESLLQSPTPCVLALIDIDDFKQINDTEGHTVGDALLLNVVDTLARLCRPGETLARFGGDEFCMLCPDVVPERLRDRLEPAANRRPFSVKLEERSVEVALSLSIGIAAARTGDTPTCLLDRADAALYEVKRTGKGRVELHPDRGQ